MVIGGPFYHTHPPHFGGSEPRQWRLRSRVFAGFALPAGEVQVDEWHIRDGCIVEALVLAVDGGAFQDAADGLGGIVDVVLALLDKPGFRPFAALG